MMSDKLIEQDPPENIYCPSCGAEQSEQWNIKHGLSDTGYIHDDISMQCGECGNKWPHGVPINPGPNPVSDGDLWCRACDDSWLFVHRVDLLLDANVVLLQLKCPNCYYFTKTARHPDDRGLVLVGYPPITGELNMDKPDGFVPEKLDGDAAREDTGLKETFEKRIEESLQQGGDGLPTSVKQLSVPVYRPGEDDVDEVVLPEDPVVVETQPTGQGKVIGTGDAFMQKHGVVYCDVELQGEYFAEDATIAPVLLVDGNEAELLSLFLTANPEDEKLAGNIAHNDGVDHDGE